MIFPKSTFLMATAIPFVYNRQALAASDECTSIETITCLPTTSAPTLDGNTADWSSIETFETPLTGALNPQLYAHGNVKIQCVHDSSRVYFLFQVPGSYRFDTEDNHKCASMSTMWKMGEYASLFNMGGCPLAEAVNCEVAPEECEDYKVDLGGHWELRTTSKATAYDVNDKTGDDITANKDDEYSVGPFCRFDDDDVNAGNEWAGAWDHISYAEDDTNLEASDHAKNLLVDGMYAFEMSRKLKTPSAQTDVQLEAGKEYGFGFAFWDPFETDSGWSDSGHFVTGCSKDWISLRLANADGTLSDETTDVEVADSPAESSTSSATLVGPVAFYGIAALFTLAYLVADSIASSMMN